MWTKVAVLSIGGTLGVNARYWLGVWMNRWASPQFPWATVLINISGSFLIGFLSIALARWMPHPGLRLMVITGFLGGYTTFSTFENDTLTLWERGEGILVAANVLGSVAVGFAAVVLGTAVARGLDGPAMARVPDVAPNAGMMTAAHSQPSGTEPGPLGPYQSEAQAREVPPPSDETARVESISTGVEATARNRGHRDGRGEGQ